MEKAHQRKIRERLALSESIPQVNLAPSNAIVRQISAKEAKEIILKYEWLGCMPAIVKYCYGLFFDGYLAGAVVYGTEYTENLGVWDKYGYTGKILLLSRGACVHWAPPFAGSMLIARSIKLLPPQYEVITATVDALAGEIGTIYQACGFYYVGSMRESNPKCTGKERFGVIIDGKLYGSRAIRQKLGCQRKEEILKRWPKAQFVKQLNKGRYFVFKCSKKVHKQHLQAIQHLIKPYPKRDGNDSK